MSQAATFSVVGAGSTSIKKTSCCTSSSRAVMRACSWVVARVFLFGMAVFRWVDVHAVSFVFFQKKGVVKWRQTL